jgi:hypothetical protein
VRAHILKAILSMIFVAAASSAWSATFTIGGTLSGLKGTGPLVLLNNKTDALPLSANGSFTFSKGLAKGASYDVSVHTQPPGQICTVADGAGTVATKDVTNVKVTCVDAYTIGGTITGLDVKDKLTLLDNGGDALSILILTSSSKGVSFTFKTPIATGGSYDVTVGTPPTDQVCTVTKGSGTVAKANVTNVVVACKLGYTVGGEVTGLKTGQTLTVQDNGGNPLAVKGSISGKEVFTFTTALANGASYAVSVKTQPASETCKVTLGSGKIASKDVTNVAVACKQNPFTIGGTINGLKKSSTIVLLNNGGDSLTRIGTGSAIKFTFSSGLVTSSKYDVTIGTQPPDQVCTVTHGTGTVASADVTNVVVTCVAGYTIGGTVKGLKLGESMTLENNGGNTLPVKGTITGTAGFTFTTALANGASYDVSVSVPPTGETCTITKGSGKVSSANVTNVVIVCTAAATTYTVGGVINFVDGGGGVTVLINGGNSFSASAASASTVDFTLGAKLSSGTSYTVTINSPTPTGEICAVVNGTGKIGSANVTNVIVNCYAPVFTVGGSVTFTGSGGGVTLLINGGNSFTITAGSASVVDFTSGLKLANTASYAVTVSSATPTGENCTVTNGSGTIAAANVTNVAVSCSPPAATTYSVGGTISGLTSGTVTLLNEGGDSLTQGNGSFTFSNKLANGAPYDVTVSLAPSGMTCTVTNGSGNIASANVTDVSVSCSASTTGGSGGSYWIPITANPVPSTTGGTTGMAIFPSNKIATNPTPALQWVTTTPTQVLALALDISFSGSVLTNYAPDLLMYAATGKDGMIHIYGLSVGDTSSVPTPTQIGNLSLDPTQFQVCSNVTQAQTSLSDPTSMFVVIYVASATTEMNPDPCIEGAGTYEVVHYTDSSSTAPAVVSISPFEGIDPIYNDGSLSGLLLLDSTTHDLDLYADDTFSSPTKLLSGVQLYTIAGAYLNNGSTFGTTNDFITVSGTSDSGLYLLKGGSTTATLIHAGTIGGTTQDDNNVYFTDTSSATTTDIYQVANTGGTPSLLYSGPATVNVGTPPVSATLEYQFMGSNDSVLIFGTYPFSESTVIPATSTIYKIPVGTKSTSLTTIGGPYTGYVDGFLAAPKPNDLANSVLFVTITNATGTLPSQTVSYSSVAIPPAGPFTQTPTANSVYTGFGAYLDQLSEAVFQIKGINAAAGGWGGANFYHVDVSTLADTVMTNPGGGDYAIPTTPSGAAYVGTLAGFLTDNTAEGILLGSNALTFETTPSIGLAADTSKDVMIQFAISNTNVLVSF